jgi:hypothetical protein
MTDHFKARMAQSSKRDAWLATFDYRSLSPLEQQGDKEGQQQD